MLLRLSVLPKVERLFNIDESNPINPAATRNPYNYLLGFVEAAGLIGEATQYVHGLMPANYAVYNKGKTATLDFNTLKEIGRLYCSINSTNGPIAGSYYWGVYNFGWDNGHFVQLAFGTLDTSFIAIYARSFYGNSGWTAWHQIVKA